MINLSKLKNEYPYSEAAFVLGMGRSGYSTAIALIKNGWTVYVWDDDEVRRKDAQEKAQKAGFKFMFLDPGENSEKFFSDAGMIIPSPGIPHTHPYIEAAKKYGSLVLGDVELLSLSGLSCKTIGITGTNGKSTTTALIHHILKSVGVNTVMGGNIGVPVFNLEMPGKDGVLVLELSSYQLDLCPTFRPDIAVLLNITPDHIDRHGSMESYIASKARILEGIGTAVIGIDDKNARSLAGNTKRKVVEISVDNKFLMSAMNQGNLKGLHNYQNVLAAYAVCKELGIPEEEILAGLKTFPGLRHRQFPVRVINGVTYINDSKATNAEAASKALMSYENIYWIVGGRPKEGGLSGLEALMKNVRQGFLIGEAANDFAEWMGQNKVPHHLSRTIDVAVREAHQAAQKKKDGVVLLSPACASFDQFTSYEERGDMFAKLVNQLEESAAA